MKKCFILFFAMLLVGCDMKSEPEFIYVKNGSSYDIEAVYNSKSKIVYKNTNEVLPLEDVEFITDKVVNVNGIDNKIQVVEINKTEGFHNSTYCKIYTVKDIYNNAKYEFVIKNMYNAEITVSYTIFGVQCSEKIPAADDNTAGMLELSFMYEKPKMTFKYGANDVGFTKTDNDNRTDILLM